MPLQRLMRSCLETLCFCVRHVSLSLSPIHNTNTGATKLPCESPEQPESNSSGFTGSPERREELNVLHRQAPDTIPLSEGNDLTALPEFVRRTSAGNSFVRRTSSGNSLQRDTKSPWDGIMDVVNNFNNFCAPVSFEDKQSESVHGIVQEIVITSDRLFEVCLAINNVLCFCFSPYLVFRTQGNPILSIM